MTNTTQTQTRSGVRAADRVTGCGVRWEEIGGMVHVCTRHDAGALFHSDDYAIWDGAGRFMLRAQR